ncbi:hypothetical protein FOZ63_028100 [Perkinsus olseni]|uniref:3'-5' exonuclease domain-containing protein n=1 Tax=Perkinsus olseni TaxID=32597 RepID=A0A7J6RY45_PEROL|nr:hypothetical protein FOZ63_028100 [Perkinsus olseni]KAF4753754.1 hypothetical protein FOZ62_026381 [Perkinsus olseni]
MPHVPATKFDTYGGKVRVVEDSNHNVDYYRERLSRESVIGVDVEWEPDSRGQSNNASMVQIATPSEVFIFRDKGNGLHPAAREALTDPNKTKVTCGHNYNGSKKMKQTYGFDLPKDSTVEMTKEARSRGLQKWGIKGQCDASGYNLYKPSTRGERREMYGWNSDRLTPNQVRHAATDAYMPLKMAAEQGIVDVGRGREREMDGNMGHWYKSNRTSEARNSESSSSQWQSGGGRAYKRSGGGGGSPRSYGGRRNYY